MFIVESVCKMCKKKFNQAESGYCPHCGHYNGNWWEDVSANPGATIKPLSEEEKNHLLRKYSK